MMPLCTTTMRPVQSRCGCAFSSVGPAVGGPARVADAVVPVERIGLQRLLEARELAGAPAQIDAAVAHDGDAGRIVAPVLKPPQAVEQDRDDRARADVADDAAHE